MADVEISYNNSVIASLSDSGTEILETDGTFMSDDITVTYTSPGGGGATLVDVSVSTSNGSISNWYIPSGATRSGNTVTLPNDSMFAVYFSGEIDSVSTTGTVSRDISAAFSWAVVLIYPGSSGGSISITGTK